MRAGVWPDVLRQAGWGKLRLPESTMSVEDYGCLLLCYTQALRDLEVDPEATPLSVIKATKELTGRDRVWFAGEPVQTQLAKAVGLTAGDVVRCPPQPAQEMRRVLLAALDVGLAILNVNHDGDAAPDHFVLARRLEGDRVWYADPATGAESWLDLRTLSGTSLWKTRKGTITKVYSALSVRPLAHLPVR